MRNQQLTKESNELRLENDETRFQLEAVQTSTASRAEVGSMPCVILHAHALQLVQVLTLETALAAARQELSASQKTQLSLSEQLLHTKDELSTAQCVVPCSAMSVPHNPLSDLAEEKAKELADLHVLVATLEQRTQAAEARAEQASTAAELAQEEIVRRRDEGDVLHGRVQHLEREVNELAHRMRVGAGGGVLPR